MLCEGECGNPAEIVLCVGEQRFNVCLECYNRWAREQRYREGEE